MRISIYLFVMFAFLGLSIKAAGPDEIVWSLKAPDHKFIWQNFVTGTGLHQKSPSTYHVTVGRVKDVNAEDRAALKKHMEAKMSKLRKSKLRFVIDRADHHLVNKRTKKNSGIVFFGDEETTARLRKFNEEFSDHLKSFKSPSGKVYVFISDLKPGIYTPHMTLANHGHIAKQKVDKEKTIKAVNTKLQTYKDNQTDQKPFSVILK